MALIIIVIIRVKQRGVEKQKRQGAMKQIESKSITPYGAGYETNCVVRRELALNRLYVYMRVVRERARVCVNASLCVYVYIVN